VFYTTKQQSEKALDFYNTSLKKAAADQYLIASNYRNMGICILELQHIQLLQILRYISES
jgi:hypothetical protein